MKRNSIPKPALIYLLIGLALTTLVPISNRFFPLPDVMSGFMTGLGLTFEIVALVLIQRSKRGQKCEALRK